ncbi:hypothetical protein FNV43_RR04464 [Rhamnella rubrinervis]|uniref:Plastocyanin-like domain-containing protein n=1 Tax=Rhamnella rubrinervis TaxID=2594499 RepID=A0A8K0HLU0_9ROSA|nr:hypothetical protein FNV43_RR04464 [Rhamnella rubrinervis]
MSLDAYTINGLHAHCIIVRQSSWTNHKCSSKTKPNFPNATFFMTARPYFRPWHFRQLHRGGILEYEHPSKTSHSTLSMKKLPLFGPALPALNDTTFATKFTARLRSLANPKFPAKVPQNVDKHFFFTVGREQILVITKDNQTCRGPNGTIHYFGKSFGVYSSNFPSSPLVPFNYTGTPPNNTMVSNGTELVVLPFNTIVELVMQDTSILGAESHPLHLHGFNFFVVGQGFGNFDQNKDPQTSTVDPIERNTVGVPSGGWVAIRFLADNPVYGSCIATLRFTQAGVEDGMVGLRWKASQSKVASSTIRSSQMLMFHSLS